MRLYKEDLPPTLVGVLELERQEGFEQGIEQGIEKGIEQGIEKGIKQIIIGLIEKGVEDEWVAEVAKLPVAKVQEIRKELKSSDRL
ncbi:hypothetical protein [Lysinibacillus xylanilyticus]|uniref:hypothetical protein n=1 Tax=Lysinibacillus xylanilyticus TaxID=582475 RepID=UPI003CFE88DB